MQLEVQCNCDVIITTKYEWESKFWKKTGLALGSWRWQVVNIKKTYRFCRQVGRLTSFDCVFVGEKCRLGILASHFEGKPPRIFQEFMRNSSITNQNFHPALHVWSHDLCLCEIPRDHFWQQEVKCALANVVVLLTCVSSVLRKCRFITQITSKSTTWAVGNPCQNGCPTGGEELWWKKMWSCEKESV